MNLFADLDEVQSEARAVSQVDAASMGKGMNSCAKGVVKGTFALPPGNDHVLVVPCSGGADSSCLAIVLKEMFPEASFRYVFTDTGADPEELYEVLDKLEAYLGRPIERVKPLRNLWELIEQYGGYLPSSSARWCTRLLKKAPLDEWLEQFKGRPIAMFVGIRADESFRLAFTMDGVTTLMPLLDLGWTRAMVFQKLRETIGIPRYYRVRSRSGCAPCPFQRRSELIGLLQENPREFERGERYEKLSEEDATRHDTAPPLDKETGFSPNWLWLPKPTRYDGIDGRLGAKGETLFGDVGVFVGAEYFLDWAPGGRPFVWQHRIVSFSSTLSGIKRQLNTRFDHLLATAEAHDMDEWQVRNQVEFAIYYLEAPTSVFDPSGPQAKSFTWHSGESYRQLRHVHSWAWRVLTAHTLSCSADRRDRYDPLSAGWELANESRIGLEAAVNPLGRVVAMTLYRAQEPDVEDVVDEKFVTCALCSV